MGAALSVPTKVFTAAFAVPMHMLNVKTIPSKERKVFFMKVS